MDESHFKALMELARNGQISQRELAARVGLSLGRINFIVNSLIEKGYVKTQRFRNSDNKLAYIYALTPSGMKRKISVTKLFISEKTREYERLLREINELREDVARLEAKEDQGPESVSEP
jgi:EPS-associated MarR family transcriptional regulator